MRKILTLGVILASLATAACNTIAGVGRDLSAAGDAVAGAADEAKR
jgi:predicted small secreted protein